MSRFSSLAVALVLTAAGAEAAPPAPTTDTTNARASFQNGLTLAQQGDLHEALAAFEAAYAAQPHFSVLYNIGQARAALGRPVEAVAAFERYLADGGKQISEARRVAVRTLIAANREHIGRLRIEGGSPNSRVWLDGVEVPAEAQKEPIPLAKGEHAIIVWNGAGPPESRTVSVAADEVKIAILNPPMKSEQTPTPTAYLTISCSVPDIRVELIGVSEIKTPQLRPWQVPAGSLSVRFSRPGYPTLTQSVLTTAEQQTRVNCNQRSLSPIPAQWATRLNLVLDPPDAVVLVDGHPYAGEAVPYGKHDIRIERDGYTAVERRISLDAGRTQFLTFSLAPTTRERERRARAQARSRTAALALGGLGLAALAGSASVYAWNSGRYDDWQKKRATGTATPEDAAGIQRGDDAALGLLIGGAVFGLGAGWALFSSP